MKFTEKLRRVSAEINKSKAARGAGLPANAINNYISQGSMPRADIAVKLARALGVSVEWLADDRYGWPPHKSERIGADTLTDSELMDEIAKRYRVSVAEMLSNLEGSKQIDWLRMAHFGP